MIKPPGVLRLMSFGKSLPTRARKAAGFFFATFCRYSTPPAFSNATSIMTLSSRPTLLTDPFGRPLPAFGGRTPLRPLTQYPLSSLLSVLSRTFRELPRDTPSFGMALVAVHHGPCGGVARGTVTEM